MPETKRHMLARTMLFLLLKDAFPGVALGSDQFVYFDPRDPRKNLAPDLFVKVGAADELFDTWKVWERGAPDLAVEIVSDWDHPEREWADKLERYAASGVRELVRFDPDDVRGPIRIWDRVGGRLLERSQDDPNLRACGALGCFWVVAPSELGPELRPRARPGGARPLPDAERGARPLGVRPGGRASSPHRGGARARRRTIGALARRRRTRARGGRALARGREACAGRARAGRGPRGARPAPRRTRKVTATLPGTSFRAACGHPLRKDTTSRTMRWRRASPSSGKMGMATTSRAARSATGMLPSL